MKCHGAYVIDWDDTGATSIAAAHLPDVNVRSVCAGHAFRDVQITVPALEGSRTRQNCCQGGNKALPSIYS